MPQIPIPDDIKSMPFETAIAELENLVSKMDQGGLSLEELTNGFERGKLLSRFCRGKLSALERKIEILSQDDGNDGKWEDFSPENPRSRATAPVEKDQNELPF